jgi:hypothetical protein
MNKVYHQVFFGLALLVLSVCSVLPVRAQGSNQDRLMLSLGALYERGFDATVAWEHETKYHHAWEYFATGYLKYCDDPDAGHVTTKSFWDSYNTWHVGIAYKPCVSRGRNHHGNARLGISGGSDRHRFVGGIHVGYEHSYALKQGWQLFFQVKEDVIIKGDDLFRTGVAVGVKVPL